MNQFKSVKLMLFMVIMMFFVTSCVTMSGSTGSDPLIDNTYKILKSTQAGYDNGMKTVAALYEQGKISTEQKEQIVVVAKQFVVAYELAVSALETYAKGTTGKATVDESITSFIDIQVKFVNLMREVISNG